MLTSPVADPTSWTWTSILAPVLPAGLSAAFPSTAPGPPPSGTAIQPEVQPEAIRGMRGGAPAAIVFPFTGHVHHHHDTAENVHWLWGSAADLGRYPALRTGLPEGNPLIVMRFTHTDAADPDAFPSDGVERGATVALAGGAATTIDELLIVAAVPRRPGLDTLGVLRAIREAQDLAIPTKPSTAAFGDFVTALDGIDQPLRLLEPAGRPQSGQSITISGPALSQTATLQPSDRGNVLAAAGLTRADIPAGALLTVADPAEEVTVVNWGAGTATGTIDLPADTPHIDLARLDSWFGPQGSAELERYTRDNRVVPFINGPEFFDDLFNELHRPPGTTPTGVIPVAFYLAGYGIDHTTKLIPEDHPAANRSLSDVVTKLADDGAEARFLALQFMQLEPSFEDTLELTAAVAAMLIAAGGIVMLAAVDADGWDGANFFGHVTAVSFGSLFAVTQVRDLLPTFEHNKAAIDALAAIPEVEAHLDPYPAECPDNPICVGGNPLVSLVHRAQKRFNAFHQKIAVVRNETGIHSYCGGIDLAANRLDDRDHGRRKPYHDVHARVDGLAAGELATTFSERWERTASTPLALDAPGALDDLPTSGSDIVQVGRTYFGPDPSDTSRQLGFAPAGERTILDTLLAAIGQARRYIYIEDQYLTPPAALTDALVAAAGDVSGPLIILIPETPDQPFGFAPRQRTIDALAAAWGDRLKVGTLRQRFSRAQTTRANATGRLWLVDEVEPGDETVKLGPPERVPGTPFWIVVGKEVMRCLRKIPETDDGDGVLVDVERGEQTNLFDHDSGTSRAAHKAGAAVVGGSFPGVYVHSKIMLIDDVFASIGSANSNRRGYYSDGECNLFALRSELTHGDNWIKTLRMRLWAEALGVTEEFATVAFDAPDRHLGLFDRRFLVGSRFTPFAAQPFTTEVDLRTQVLASASTLDVLSFGAHLLAAEAVTLAGLDADILFDAIVDPSSHVASP